MIWRLSSFSAALVAAIIGFGGTLALVLAAAQAVGATPVQTASWVTVICFAIAVESLVLSVWFRMPIVAAWTAAGLALIGASTGYSIDQAVGAFIVTGLLLLATGLFRPLARLVERIPAAISAGMLAGVLFPFVVAGAGAAATQPGYIVPLALAFFVLRVFSPSLAVVAVLVAGIGWAFVAGATATDLTLQPSRIVLVAPEFSLAALIGLALPLYIVTMASQNLPGLAVLRADGYTPPAGPLIAVTGLASALSAPFGASTTNLSAITAAICTGPDAHPDRDQRWVTGVWYAVIYAVFAVFGASLIALVAALPPVLIALVTGLALLAPMANATGIAVADADDRLAAIATFAVTASGVAFLGIGAAFWGLALGLLVHFLGSLKR